ncbi:MAG: hypothetical protein QOE92_2039 [Chloroflexota bacterium]|nr:hypothetical protein [Chloroflexota bacterium]
MSTFHVPLSSGTLRPQGQPGRLRRRLLAILLQLSVVASVTLAAVGPALLNATVAEAAADDWPAFLHDAARTSKSTDTGITTANAGQLRPTWSFSTGGPIAAQPAIVGGVAYVGSWDGYMYAVNTANGAQVWKTFTGITHDPPCHPPDIGITSAATVANGVVYFGGGDAYWYALRASDGAVLWRVFTGDNTEAGAHYNWSSPLIVGNFAYIGIASNCDAPLVQGQLMKVDLTTHQVVGVTNVVDDGQVGGGIWTSPTIDVATNTIYVTTGTINLFSQKYSQALLAIDAGTMAIKDSFQLPFAEAVSDSDWGNTPTLSVDSNGRKLVTASNKNGIMYTFDRANLHQGTVWKANLAYGGDCPTCGDGTISSAAFANGTLYQAGGSTTISGIGHQGAVRAVNPLNGAFLWEHGTQDPVLGSVAYVNGMIVDAQMSTLEVLDASNGNSLFDWHFNTMFFAAPSVASGKVFIGGLDGKLYAFAPVAPTVPAADVKCPTGYTCQDIGAPKAGTEKVNNDGSWTVTASGKGARQNADQMRIITKPATGDFEVKMDLLSGSGGKVNGYLSPHFGIMIRETNDPGSPMYTALSDPVYPAENQTQPNLISFFRDKWNTQVTELTQMYPMAFPRWIMVQRRGDELQTLFSNDNVNWTLVSGTIHRVVMRSTLMVGMGSAGGTSTDLSNNTITGLSIGPITVNSYARQNSNHACPNTWSCVDVGAGSPIGDQTLANGTWTLQGTAPGIGQFEDHFHYVYKTLPGDGTMTARLTSLGNSNPAAQAAVIMRGDVSIGSAYYAIVNTAGQGAQVQWREHNNLETTRLPIPITVTMPEYFQIARYTDTQHSPVLTTYSALTSTDGVNWTQVPGSTVALNLGSSVLAGIGGSSNANRVRNPSTWTNVATSTQRIRPPGICPDEFTCENVGTGFAPGSQIFSNGTWNIEAAGTDMWDVYDQFHFAYQPLAGDGTISANVVSIQGAGEWAKEGVMIRASNDPQAPYYGVFITPQHGTVVQWRNAQGEFTNSMPAGVGTLPRFVLAARWTDTSPGGLTYYTAYTSPDGVNFTPVPGSTMALNMPGTVITGIANTSYDQANTASVVMDNVAQLPSAPRPPGVCPSSWSCSDIGGALPAGTQDVDQAGVWTTNVGGGDIWDTSDQFHLISQSMTGDGTMSARLVSSANAGEWAKDGVMLRADGSAGSPYYGLFATPQHGLTLQYRTTQGGTTNQLGLAGTAPTYLQVSRYTDGGGTQYLSAATSPDGNTWTTVPGSTVNMTLPAQVLAGMAADSYNQGTSSTVKWDHVVVGGAVTPPPGACPAGYGCADIGGAQPAGSQSLNGTTLTVSGGGGDIWASSDQFRFVQKSLAGDGTVSAAVSAQAATSPWAKAGVMLRASGAPDAPYYGVFRTPGNGYVVQGRTTTGGTTTSMALTGSPAYVRVARWTDTNGPTTWLTAYTSTDGNTWTVVPNSTVAMALTGTLQAGFAVTSHAQGTLGSATFGNATVATGATQPPGVCPAGYTCTDVGGAMPPGAQDLNAGTWTIKGGGGDIWGTSDQFHLVSQSRAGDGSVTVRLTAQAATNPWAKAGAVARASTAGDAAYYGVFATPANGVVVQWRPTTGAASSQVKIAGTVPAWLRITRTGTSFTAFTSPDGVTWTAIANSTVAVAALSGTLVEGLGVSSHDTTQQCTVTAPTFTIS